MMTIPYSLSPAWILAMGASLGALPVVAQTFPAKPLNLVVTVTAGGSIDAVARLIAADLGPALGQPVIVVNRPGVGGNVAGESVARAAPDGHTMMISSSSTLTVNPHVYKNMPFDSLKSFAPIVMPARLNLIVAVHPRHAVNNVKEFVELLKSQPGKLTFGSSGNGTNPQLGGVLFDKVKALGVIGPARLPSLPSVPTLTELGFADMTAVNGFYAIVATAGTPADVVTRLNTEMVRIMRQQKSMDRINTMGLVNATSTPEQLGQAIADDLRRLGPIIQEAKISPQ